MNAADMLNRIFCQEKMKLFCIEGGYYFELAFWNTIAVIAILLFYCWREGPYYDKPTRIDGKVVIVTGCNTGIGKEIALELARRGGHIYMACRNFAKCEAARKEIFKLTGNPNVFNRTLDLASMQSVREFARTFNKDVRRLDILINNAGIMATPRKLTVDGFEEQFAVNHLGHFLLTNLLLEKLKSSAPSRVVVVTSLAHIIGNINRDDINSARHYVPYKVYAQSKLANILFTRKLAEKLLNDNVTVNCLHPGSVRGEWTRGNAVVNFLGNLFSKYLLRSPRAGAQTALYLALDPEVSKTTGGYFDRMGLVPVLQKARDESTANWLWRQSEIMTQLKRTV